MPREDSDCKGTEEVEPLPTCERRADRAFGLESPGEWPALARLGLDSPVGRELSEPLADLASGVDAEEELFEVCAASLCLLLGDEDDTWIVEVFSGGTSDPDSAEVLTLAALPPSVIEYDEASSWVS